MEWMRWLLMACFSDGAGGVGWMDGLLYPGNMVILYNFGPLVMVEA